MPTDGLAGKGALVAGAGSSVGLVVAERLQAAGVRVHIADANADFVARTLQDNPALSGSLCDVAEPSEVEALFVDARRHVGEIDFLINCVGIAGSHALVEDVTPTDWHRSIAVNLGGAFELMRRVIPPMKARRRGAIVNFSTASTKTGLPSRAPYVASKAALEALTYTAARELGSFGVRCNAIRPGAINNGRLEMIVNRNAKQRGIGASEAEASLLRYVTLRAKIEPSELAAMVLFLCSDDGIHITGQFIEVSGNLEWEE